ncbi:AHH domain-containing protein [Shewanella sp. ALD9]|uniref:AHH domain-containing protein n=1 Tax=Shewanella sp. ALD9 TaxID=2058330 RepID=UPI000C336A58|nr:AHH domain-containing protein [Shewanella sp. ALD9]PKH31972.1 hypothetical protein CXF88_08705 [Shewanella sp. ALD9]
MSAIQQPITTYPQPTRPNEPSALEMAIYNFELKAKKYYDAKQKSNNSKQVQSQLDQDYKHLQEQRKRIESVAIAQSYLQDYRDVSSKASLSDLKSEAHHPTRKLANFLFAIGEPQPTSNHEAHHIISGKGRFLQAQIIAARLNMHLCGIGINDPINGTWLINFLSNKQFDWATSEAPPHRKLHRQNYERWIGTTLGKKGLSTQGKAKFFNELRIVKNHIRTGTLPANIFEADEQIWKGL